LGHVELYMTSVCGHSCSDKPLPSTTMAIRWCAETVILGVWITERAYHNLKFVYKWRDDQDMHGLIKSISSIVATSRTEREENSDSFQHMTIW